MTTLNHHPTHTPGAPTPPDAARASRRDWLALAVLMLPVLLVSVDNTVLSFALPSLSADLRPTATQLLWTVDIYALVLAGLLVAMGSFGDRVGRRRLLLIGATGFGAASMLAAFSSSPEMLIAARAMLGFFGAMLMPSTLSIIRNVFTHAGDRRLAIATWAAMFSGGAALGPVLGGWLLEHFWWGSVFLINGPLVLAFLPLALWLLPESRDPRPGPIDLPSIALSLAAMLPIVYGIKHIAHAGVDDVAALTLGGGLLAAAAFVRRQRRLTHPMIDVTLFADRVFSGAVMANLLSLMGLTGFLFFAAQLLQLGLGLSPLDAALVLVPGLAVTVIAGFVAVRLARVIAIRALVTGSFLASASGYALAAFAGQASVGLVLVAFAVLGLGIGIAETLTNDLVLSAVPANRAGAASAISETAYELGAVLGVAVLGSVLTATFRAQLDVPAPLGADSAGFETLGSTLQQAATLPDYLGEPLAASARAAFEAGVHASSAAAIIVALLAAAVSWRSLRGAR